MADAESAARFERFALMRLEGKNDIIYRNYDLLTKEREQGSLRLYLRAAGQPIPARDLTESLRLLQRKFLEWGFGINTLGDIETLLHEFWVYQRIKHYGKRNWPLRENDEIRRLMAEHIKANG